MSATQNNQHGLKDHSHGAVQTDEHGISVESRATQFKSFDVNDFPPITGREEQWRFTPLRNLRNIHSADPEDIKGSATISVENVPENKVTVETVDSSDDRIGIAGKPEDRVSALGWTASQEAVIVTITENSSLDQPLEISITAPDNELRTAQLVIIAGKYSKGTVVLDHQGDASLIENVEIITEDSSNLTVVTIQDWDAPAIHFSSQFNRVGPDSALKHIMVTFGGSMVRMVPTVSYQGSGGDANLWGLYFADAGQHLEQRLFVDHNTPRCVSRVTYKGALQGQDARSVWVGDVLIRKEAEETDTYEINRNLVLTEGARADSVPNLEIETGKIEGAGHASATGRFDDEQLYYLMSRGMNEYTARRLVVRGFLNEVIQQIDDESLEARLSQDIENELNKNAH